MLVEQLQSRKEHHRTCLQPKSPLRENLQRQQDLYHVFIDFREGLRQGLACSFVGNHEEAQHQHQPYLSHKNLYDKATSAVLLNSSIGDWSEQQLESDKDDYSHPSSSTYFWKGLRQTPYKNTKSLSALEAEKLPISALLMTSMA